MARIQPLILHEGHKPKITAAALNCLKEKRTDEADGLLFGFVNETLARVSSSERVS